MQHYQIYSFFVCPEFEDHSYRKEHIELDNEPWSIHNICSFSASPSLQKDNIELPPRNLAQLTEVNKYYSFSQSFPEKKKKSKNNEITWRQCTGEAVRLTLLDLANSCLFITHVFHNHRSTRLMNSCKTWNSYSRKPSLNWTN